MTHGTHLLYMYNYLSNYSYVLRTNLYIPFSYFIIIYFLYLSIFIINETSLIVFTVYNFLKMFVATKIQYGYFFTTLFLKHVRVVRAPYQRNNDLYFQKNFMSTKDRPFFFDLLVPLNIGSTSSFLNIASLAYWCHLYISLHFKIVSVCLD